MVNFGQGYNPPGVYIGEDATPMAATPITGVPTQRIVLIGASSGNQTRTTQIQLSTTPATLPDLGIDVATINVATVNSSEVVDPSLYSVVKGNPPVGGSNRNYQTTISSSSETDAVWVSYTYTDPDYFTPTLMDSLEEIIAKYGAPFSVDPAAASQITSPITLAALLAFANGAPQVVMAPFDAPSQTATDVRAAIQSVYTRINTTYENTIIVPIPTGMSSVSDAQNILGDLSGHLNSTAAEGFFRVGVVGFPVDPASPVDPAALGVSNSRLMMAYAAPGGLQMYNSTTGRALTVGHEYLAAALAGRMAYVAVQKSLTREQMAGFSGIVGKPLSAAEKNAASAAGITVLESDRTGRLVVRHAITTDPRNVMSAELSLTRARDSMVSILQTSLDGAGLIGDPINLDTPMSVKTIASGALELCKGQGVIVDYSNLQVRQASANPSVIEVRFAYKPSFPLNYITVTFSVDLSMSTDPAITDVTETNSVS